MRPWMRLVRNTAIAVAIGLLAVPTLAQGGGGRPGGGQRGRGGFGLTGVIESITSTALTLKVQARGQRPGGQQGGGQRQAGEARSVTVKLTGDTKYYEVKTAASSDLKAGQPIVLAGSGERDDLTAKAGAVYTGELGEDARANMAPAMMAMMPVMQAAGGGQQQGQDQRPTMLMGIIKSVKPLVVTTRNREGETSDLTVALAGGMKWFKVVDIERTTLAKGRTATVRPVRQQREGGGNQGNRRPQQNQPQGDLTAESVCMFPAK